PHSPTLDTYTLSLHDALPISARRTSAPPRSAAGRSCVSFGAAGLAGLIEQSLDRRRREPHVAGDRPDGVGAGGCGGDHVGDGVGDRKSTRLNSSHVKISYAVF